MTDISKIQVIDRIDNKTIFSGLLPRNFTQAIINSEIIAKIHEVTGQITIQFNTPFKNIKDMMDLKGEYYEDVVKDFAYRQYITMKNYFFISPNTYMFMVVLGYYHGSDKVLLIEILNKAQQEILNSRFKEVFIAAMHFYDMEHYLPEEYQEIKI